MNIIKTIKLSKQYEMGKNLVNALNDVNLENIYV